MLPTGKKENTSAKCFVLPAYRLYAHILLWAESLGMKLSKAEKIAFLGLQTLYFAIIGLQTSTSLKRPLKY